MKVFRTAGLSTSRLGFGCANLMARIGRRDSRRILDLAFDSGVRHFDTAPLYGYGEGESLVGDFIAARRHEITVATKFGILPPRRSGLLALAKTAARAVVTVAPSMRERLRKRAASMTQKGSFGIAEANKSIEHSLRELRTDYIDLLLMHDVDPEQITPELIDLLEEKKRQGKIRHYGTATTFARTLAIRARGISGGDVAQFPSSLFNDAAETYLREGSSAAVITHSALGRDFLALRQRLAQDNELRNIWSSTLDLDAGDSTRLGALFLYATLLQNPEGIALFSSLRPENIRANGALLHSVPFEIQQVQHLRNLVANLAVEDRVLAGNAMSGVTQ